MIPSVYGKTGLDIPNIDAQAGSGAALNVGDVIPMPASFIVAGAAQGGLSTATAVTRKCSTAAVALTPTSATGQSLRVRVQGRVQALVKNTAGNAIAVGDRLCFGTGKAFDAEPPTVNTNRWVAIADEAVAAGTSTTASLRYVILLGLDGLGMQATGA